MYQPIRVQYFTVGENSGTSKEARDFKIDTELPGDMHTASLTWNTPLTLKTFLSLKNIWMVFGYRFDVWKDTA